MKKAKATPTMTVDDAVNQARPPEELLALQAENKELHSRIKMYKREHGQVESLIHQVIAAAPKSAPVPILYKPDKNMEVTTPCDVALNLCDLHYGAMQESDEIEGFGEFSPEICERRMTNLVNDLLAWVTIKRHGYNVRRLHILGTGDYISGDIHEELKITNAFPAPVQAVECGVMLSKLVLALSQHFGAVVVHMITDDNHGRMTKKCQAKQAGLNNYSYVVGRWMQQQCSQQSNVTINVIPRPWESVECNGRRYLLTHGHRVAGWAGFPYYGIERLVAREALKRMNAAEIRKFHKVVLGHWHAPLSHPWYWIGGSVSGTDAYDHGQGRYSEPKQVSWMIHPEHGEFDRTEWLLRA